MVTDWALYEHRVACTRLNDPGMLLVVIHYLYYVGFP
jgi:hypothetical protein